MTKNIAPPQLVKEANQAKKLFCDTWASLKTNTMELGRAIVWIESKGLHKYIPKEGSRKGYQSLEEFALAMTNGECGSTKMWDAKRIYLLTQGENAIPAETVAKMPKRNQLQVARVKKADSKAVTKKLIEKAVSEPILKFAETAQDVINETKPPEKRKEPTTDVVLRGIHVRVANEFYEMFDKVKLLPVILDGDRMFNFETKALAVITACCEANLQDDFIAARKKANDEAPSIPEAVDEDNQAKPDKAVKRSRGVRPADVDEVEYSAPDASERIGLAEAEGRVVHRHPEARH
jgi:hypothetical protein